MEPDRTDQTQQTHQENAPIQINREFLPKKKPDKNSDNCHISAQNIDCGYSLEPPRRVPTIFVFEQKKEENVYPCKPQFYFIKMGFKGVKIIV